MTEKLNEDTVKLLPCPKEGNKVYFFADAVLQGKKAPDGFGVRVTAAGVKSFVIDYRVKGKENKGKQRRYTIGKWQKPWSVLNAVIEARALRERIDLGEDPLKDREAEAPAPKTKMVSEVIDDFIKQHVKSKLRSADKIESAFKRLVKPNLGDLGIYELRRSHVAGMLDKIETENGPVMADRTLAYLRKSLNWYAERDDVFNFNTAIGRPTSRANSKDHTRDRVLSDEEIRIIIPLLDEAGTFGAILKTILFTGQRPGEVAGMSRKEIDANSTWGIPAKRYKTKRPQFVPLSKAALAIIEAQKKLDECDFVFPSRAETPFSAFGKSKDELDAAILAAMQKQAKKGAKVESLPNWTPHDLRRTAKTIMARAGVNDHLSERVLGHVIPGVKGVYDRHSYADEKRDALEKLAAMIERILNPPSSNVTTLEKKRARTQ